MTTVSSMHLDSNNGYSVLHGTSSKISTDHRKQKKVPPSSSTTDRVAKKSLSTAQTKSNSTSKKTTDIPIKRSTVKGPTKLHIACRNYGSNKIEELLNDEKEKAKINVQNSNGETPLHLVCKRGSIQATRLLIESGARLDLKDKDGNTVLDTTFKHGKRSCASIIVENAKIAYLVDKEKLLSRYRQAVEKDWSEVVRHLKKDIESLGLMPQSVSTHQKITDLPKINGKTFQNFHEIFSIGNKDEIKKALNNAWGKINVNLQNSKGLTPLHCACRRETRGSLHTTKLLLQSGARLDIKDSEGNTVLDTALLLEKKSIVRLFIEGSHIELLHNDDTTTSLLKKVERLEWKDIARLINRKIAVQNGTVPKNIHIDLIEACKNNRKEEVEELLGLGINPTTINQPNQRGSTALHLACKNGGVGIVSLLLGAGAKIDAKDKRGNSALDLVFSKVLNDRGRARSCAPLLVEKCSTVQLYARDGTSLHQKALDFGWNEVAKLIEKKVLTPQRDSELQDSVVEVPTEIDNYQNDQILKPTYEKSYEETMELLIYNATKRYDISFVNERHIQLFCKNTVISILDFFIESGFDLNQGDEEGNTFLMFLLGQGCLELVDLILSHYTVDVNITNNEGKTILHIACEKGYSHVVWTLSNRATINVYDKMGFTPLYYSIHKEHEECARILMNRGATLTDIPGKVSYFSALLKRKHNPFYQHLIHKGEFSSQDMDIEEDTESETTDDDEMQDDKSFNVAQFLK